MSNQDTDSQHERMELPVQAIRVDSLGYLHKGPGMSECLFWIGPGGLLNWTSNPQPRCWLLLAMMCVAGHNKHFIDLVKTSLDIIFTFDIQGRCTRQKKDCRVLVDIWTVWVPFLWTSINLFWNLNLTTSFSNALQPTSRITRSNSPFSQTVAYP